MGVWRSREVEGHVGCWQSGLRSRERSAVGGGVVTVTVTWAVGAIPPASILIALVNQSPTQNGFRCVAGAGAKRVCRPSIVVFGRAAEGKRSLRGSGLELAAALF